MRQSGRVAIIGLLTAAIACAQTAPPPAAPPTDPKSAAPAVPTIKKKKTRSAVAALEFRVPEVRYDDVPLEQVLDNLAGLANTNLTVRWQKLAEFGIKRDSPITLNVRNLRLRQVLWLVMNHPPLSDAKLAYRADSDMILLSTADDFGQEMIVKVYDVTELLQTRLARPTMTSARQHEIVETVVPQVAAGAVAVQPVTRNYGSGSILIGEDSAGDVYDQQDQGGGATGEEDNIQQRRMAQLITTITTTVEPDEWVVNGGRCSIAPWRSHLIVRATPLVHQALGGPIDAGK
jgi:hypothetical protein